MSIRVDRYVELPDPLPATHYAENALRNCAAQLEHTKTKLEAEIFSSHVQYWEAVVNACYERDRNLSMEEKIARGLPI